MGRGLPLERQRESFTLLRSIVDRDLGLDDKDAARELFTRLTGLHKKGEVCRGRSAVKRWSALVANGRAEW